MKQVRRQTVLKVSLQGDSDGAAQLVEQHQIVDRVQSNDGCLEITLFEGIEDYSELPTLLIQEGYRLSMFCEDELNLEAAFMALTKGMQDIGKEGNAPGDDNRD
jgi:ABC-2 type transport system ATP-binding protein